MSGTAGRSHYDFCQKTVSLELRPGQISCCGNSERKGGALFFSSIGVLCPWRRLPEARSGKKGSPSFSYCSARVLEGVADIVRYSDE